MQLIGGSPKLSRGIAHLVRRLVSRIIEPAARGSETGSFLFWRCNAKRFMRLGEIVHARALAGLGPHVLQLLCPENLDVLAGSLAGWLAG
jgi:hypothetical protein